MNQMNSGANPLDESRKHPILTIMKEWRPDRQFKKADFPLKRDAEDEKNRKTDPKNRTNSNQTGTAKQNPSIPGEAKQSPARKSTSSASNASGSLKGWAVPKLGGGHVIAGGQGPQNASRTGTDKESETSANPGSAPPATGSTSGTEKDMTRVYLSQLIIQDPRGASDILRSWYWEKPGRESPVQYIPPRNRIHLILRSLSRESLLALYELMTPVERRQMEEIRKEPMHVNEREILKLRQYFMARLTGQI